MATGISTQQPPSYTPNVAGHRAAVAASFLGWTLDAFDFFLVTYTLTAIAKEFGRPDKAIALSLTITLMFRPVGAFIFGLMADRFGRRIPLMIDLVFYSVVEICTGLVHSYTAFLVLRALFGIGMGGEWGVGASLAMEAVPKRWRGLLSGVLQEGYALGYLLAALAYWTIFPTHGWRIMFFIGGLPALLSLFVRAKVKESAAWQEHKLSDWTSYRRAVGTHVRLFLYLVVLIAIMGLMSHGTQDMYPTFLQQQRHFTPREAAAITMVSMVGAIAGGLLFGWISDRIGRRRAMAIATIGAVLVVPLWVFAPTTPVIVIGAFCMQFMVQGAWGVVPAHLNELTPGPLRGFFPGFAYQLGVLCSSSIVYLEARLSEHMTYAVAMGTLAAGVSIAAAVAVSLGPEAKGVSFRKAPDGVSE
jgi:SHS family lactate transporter-like MFS transporter